MTKTIRELLIEGAARIAAGKDGSTAWLDATLLWALAVGTTRDQVLAHLGDGLVADQEDAVFRFQGYCAQRAEGLPVAYLSGKKEFFGRDFLVDPSVLIPRPETELLVEWVLETIDGGMFVPTKPLPRILDCCTGSGCIPITLGLELERRKAAADIGACDLSADALATAERNRRTLWPAGRIAWHQGDLLEALRTDDCGYGIITANPPYVPQVEARQTEARGWREPLMALDGGPDGLDLIRRLVPQARRRLNPGGWLFMEFGDGQHEAIVAILEACDYRSTEIRCDLAGLPRMVRSKSGE